MKEFCWSFWLAIVLLATPPLTAFATQEDPEPPKSPAELEAICLGKLKSSLRNRFSYLSHAIDLTAPEQDAVELALEPTMTEFAKQRVVDGFTEEDSFSGLPEGFEILMRLEIGKVVSKEKEQAIRDDLDRKDAFHSRHKRAAILMRLDLGLHLDAEQLDKLDRVLRSHSNPALLKYLDPRGADALPTQVPEEILKPVLLSEQLAYFRSASKRPSAERHLFFPADDHKRLGWFEPELEAAFEVHIAALTKQFELNATQQRKLQILKRESSKRLLALRAKAYERRRASDALFRGLRTALPSHAMARATASTLIATDEKWTRFVRGVLAEDDRERFDRLQQRRQKMYHAQVAYSSVLFYGRYANMDSRQLAATHDLLMRKVPWDRYWLRDEWPFGFQAEKMAMDEINDLLEPSQRKRLSFWIKNSHAIVAQYDRMLKAKGLVPPTGPKPH